MPAALRWAPLRGWGRQNIKGKTLPGFSYTCGAGHLSASHHKVTDAGCQISDVTWKLPISTSPHLPSLSNDFQSARWKMSPEASSHTIMMEVSLSVAHCAFFLFLRIWWKAKKRKFCNLEKRNQVDSLTWERDDCARAVLWDPNIRRTEFLMACPDCNSVVGSVTRWKG